MLRTAVAVAVLAVGAGVRAEPMELPAAPTPELPQVQLQGWRDLERRWQGMRAVPSSRGFARGAARVCAQAVAWRAGEPKPGLRALLIGQSCQGALGALVAQGSRQVGDGDTQTWKRGFVPGEDAGTLDCLALDQMARLVGEEEVRKVEPALLQRFQQAHQRCGSQQQAAERGRQALGLPLCERIAALRALLAEQGKLDWAARQLANTDAGEDLEARWNRLAGRDARYAHVIAYHLSEARIELSAFAERAALQPALAAEDAAEVREAFQCLGDFRGAPARLREFERRKAEDCCKTCSRGKACGDSCIARGKSCRVGAGCACDG